MSARHYVFRGLPRSARSAERVHQQAETHQRPRTGYAMFTFPNLWLRSSRNTLLADHPANYCSRHAKAIRSSNATSTEIWLHRILERVGLRKAERWREKNGRRRVKCLEGEGTAWHAMRRFRCTHLETELIPESLIKIWSVTARKASRSNRI
jgi:hypothetical protein